MSGVVGGKLTGKMSITGSNESVDGSGESIPVMGMIFSSTGEAEKWYQDYGEGRGFSTKRAFSYKTTRENVYTRVVFCCTCEGKHKGEVDSNGKIVNKRSTSAMKTGCLAMMRIALEPGGYGTWRVSTFRDEHNHEMVTPSKRRQVRVNKCMPSAAKSLAEPYSRERLTVGKVPSEFCGSSSSGGFDSRDRMRAVRKPLLQMEDAADVMCYFREKTLENPSFYYAVQYDEEGRAANFCWVDARSRRAYSQFGDVVTFDKAYTINKYSMSFAPFTGVNHHNQSVLFGFALLQDKTEETFTWLFKTWLEAMGGRPPITMLTDQDLTMTNAIKSVFPDTRHCFCLWHIKWKFAEKLSRVLFKKSEFKQTIKHVIRSTYTVEDFEEKWKSMLVAFDLEEHEWLKFLYSIREQWIPVFNRGTFFAGMNTTQRSKCINPFFRKFVNSKTSLREFVTCCDEALERMYYREGKEDFVSIHKNRVFSSKDCLVEHASKIYTRNIFNKVHNEFNQSLRFRSEELKIDGDEMTFKVSSKGGDNEEFIVRMNRNTKEGVCGCQMFEFEGIPCRHIHHVLYVRFSLVEIPPHFVVARWLKDANRSKVVGSNGL